VRLADLARALHLSPSSLSHRYRTAAGESPMQSLKRLRILRAKVLLLKGHSLADVAEQLGFYDQVHLSVTFKKSEGVSPRAFLNGQAGAAP